MNLLITQLEKENDKIKNRVKELEYISSAGLRVILKMCKALNGGTAEIKNTNQVVKEIFETTGFNNFIKIL